MIRWGRGRKSRMTGGEKIKRNERQRRRREEEKKGRGKKNYSDD